MNQSEKWSGPEDGLPPAGTRVEIEGCAGTVVAAANIKMQGPRAWLEMDGDGSLRIPDVRCLRPIRTDRERWIEAAKAAMDENSVVFLTEHDLGNLAQVLYDAGLAKLPVTDHE